MRKVVLLILLLTGCAKESNETISGDLCFKKGPHSYPFTWVSEINDYINSVDFNDTAAVAVMDKTILEMRAKHSHLRPFYLMIEGDSVVQLFMDSAKFKQIDQFSYSELRSSGKRVVVTAKVELKEGVYYECLDLMKVEVNDGLTRITYHPFRIDSTGVLSR